MNISAPELILKQAVNTLHTLALELVVHSDHIAIELLHILPEFEDMVHTANCHTAHRCPHMVLGHIFQCVVIGICTDGHIKHQRVHVDDHIEPPAVVCPGAPVGIIKRCTGPCDHSVASLGESVDIFADTFLHNLANLLIHLMPYFPVTVLGLVNAVECLGHAVDGVVLCVRGYIPFLPFKALQLILLLKLFLQFVPTERDTVLLLNKAPALFNLLHAVFLDQRVIKLHGHGEREKRLVKEPVLQNGGCNRGVAGLIAGNHGFGIVGHVVKNKQAGLCLAHRAWVTRKANRLNRIDIIQHSV